MNESNYIKTGEAKEFFGISYKTLERWRKAGKIKALNPTGGCWYYAIDSVSGHGNRIPKRNFLYARVSTRNQISDLDRQCKYLRSIYPENNYELVRDVCSGLNFKRKGLETILECADKKTIGKVVVAYKDRLARFGFQLLERIITRAGGELVVLNNQECSPEQEFTNDLISIITSFSARIHGFRKYKVQIQKDSHLPVDGTTPDATELDGYVQVDIQ